jgi:hypothetical protein
MSAIKRRAEIEPFQIHQSERETVKNKLFKEKKSRTDSLEFKIPMPLHERKKETSFFDDLPNEVLAQIIKYLTPKEIIVSKRFVYVYSEHIAKPMLINFFELDKKLSNDDLVRKIQEKLFLDIDLEMNFFTLMQKLFKYQAQEYNKLNLKLDDFKLDSAYELESFKDRREKILDYKLYELETVLKSFPEGQTYLQILVNPDVQIDKKSKISLMKIFLDTNQEAINMVELVDLSEVELKCVPEDLKKFKNLKILKLSYNDITKLPSWIGDLKNLESIDLSFNKLESLPEELSDLNKLKILDLFNNNLKDLPKGFSKLESLDSLDLSKNKFEEFPKEISKLKTLKSLYLALNSLKEINQDFDSKDLIHLDLRGNNLQKVPDFILNQTKLTKLFLNNNKIATLPNELDNLRNLKFFEIKNNPLDFDQLPKFKNRVISDLIYRLIPKAPHIPKLKRQEAFTIFDGLRGFYV